MHYGKYSGISINGHLPLAYVATWRGPNWNAINTLLKNTPKCEHVAIA